MLNRPAPRTEIGREMAASSPSGFLSAANLSRNDELLMNWPFNLESYNAALTLGGNAVVKLSEFENSQLSKITAVQYIRSCKDHSVFEDVISEDVLKSLHNNSHEYTHQLFFINRFIMKHGAINLPKDIKRLRVSKMAFRRLLSFYEVPPAFLTHMLYNNLTSLPIHHRHLRIQRRKVVDFFYILPIRIAMPCTERARSHVLSSAGSNQMDPSQYLHLNDVGRDIRPSKIVVYWQHDKELHHTSTICVDFQDGRWADSAEEPFLRTREALQHARGAKKIEHPFFAHLILLTSVSEWWRCALMSFNLQLISYEKQLQQHMYRPDSMADDFINETNKALHTMAAHLHRYKTEINLLEEVSAYLLKHCQCSCTDNEKLQTEPSKSASQLEKEEVANANILTRIHQLPNPCLESVASEFKSLRVFVSELESKTQTTLGLLFNNIRMANDKLLVANGDSMRKILEATSTEARLSRKMAKQSQKMAIEMRRDSTSMKAIAIMTMFFLPATSYAAILSMPFFALSPWMAEIDRAWLWVALSIPSTIAAFAIFFFYVQRGDRDIKVDEESTIEMDDL